MIISNEYAKEPKKLFQESFSFFREKIDEFLKEKLCLFAPLRFQKHKKWKLWERSKCFWNLIDLISHRLVRTVMLYFENKDLNV